MPGFGIGIGLAFTQPVAAVAATIKPSLVAGGGDSIMAGYNLPAGSATILNLGYDPKVVIDNSNSQSGASLSDYGTPTAAFWNGNFPTINGRHFISGRGHNDIVGGATAQQIFDRHTAVAASAAAYVYYYPTTILPTVIGQAGWSSTCAQTALDLNAMLRSGASSFDGIYDPASITSMNTQAAAADTSKYQEGIHPTAAGDLLLVPAMKALLDTRLTLGPKNGGQPAAIAAGTAGRLQQGLSNTTETTNYDGSWAYRATGATDGQWGGGSGLGVSTVSLAANADGWVEMLISGASNDRGAILGLQTGTTQANTYSDMVYGILTQSGGLKKVGSAAGGYADTSVQPSGLGPATLLRLQRIGTVMKARFSTDGANYTDVHTLGTNSTEHLYFSVILGNAGNDCVIEKIRTFGFA